MKEFLKNKYIAVIDLEATCWNGHPPNDQKSDIIEIGVCRINTGSLEIDSGPEILVRPKSSKISSYCEKLTSITDDMISKSGVSLYDAFKTLEEYVGRSIWCSWGFYDYRFLREISDRYDLDFPLSYNYFNLKQIYSIFSGTPNKGFGMAKALRKCNIELDGTHHRGSDDAFNSAKILKYMLEKYNG